MRVENVQPLFTSYTATSITKRRAKQLTKLAEAEVLAGDEFRTYRDGTGRVAEVILAHRISEGAIRFHATGDFLWGALLVAGPHEYLVGDGNPYVMVDLRDLGFYTRPLE
jgi:hypothetical protein